MHTRLTRKAQRLHRQLLLFILRSKKIMGQRKAQLVLKSRYLLGRWLPLNLWRLEGWLATPVKLPVKRIPRSVIVILIALIIWLLWFILTPRPIAHSNYTMFRSLPEPPVTEAFEIESRELRASGFILGNCTYGVSLMLDIPQNWGNASEWAINAKADGWTVSKEPRVGAIAQDNWGWNGAGHVAVVITVQGNGIQVREMNWYGGGGGWGRFSERWTTVEEWDWFISR